MAELLKEGEQSPGKSSEGDGGDREFEPSAEMLIHDFDDEHTLAEEEAMAMAGGEDPENELNSLQKESDMPIEELLALYGCNDKGGGWNKKGREGDAQINLDDQMEAMEDDDDEGDDDEEEDDDEDDEADDNDEEDDDDGSLESGSSSSIIAAPSEKVPIDEAILDLKKEKNLSKSSSESKSRSELHLLYQSEEGAVPEARLLRSAGATGTTGSDEEIDEEEDVDYAPGEDEWRKTIMIGSEYQASVPSGLSPYENSQTMPYENEDKLLWTPFIVADGPTEEYLQKCTQLQQQLMQSRIAATTASQPLQALALLASLPLGAHTRDDEQALYQLLQCGYNLEEALRRRKMNNVAPCDTASLWSEEECRNFESGLRVFGKDFHHIQQQKVKTRSVGELVQFYYLWKKTERHDILANRARLEKKKYALHPGTTDYMDRFLDEQETMGPMGPAGANIIRERSNSRSSSPNVHSLIYGDPKRLRVAATPPIAPNEEAGSNGTALGSMEDAGMHPSMMDHADESSGQVLTAAAAAAAAAAAILPSPDSALTSVREQIS